MSDDLAGRSRTRRFTARLTVRSCCTNRLLRSLHRSRCPPSAHTFQPRERRSVATRQSGTAASNFLLDRSLSLCRRRMCRGTRQHDRIPDRNEDAHRLKMGIPSRAPLGASTPAVIIRLAQRYWALRRILKWPGQRWLGRTSQFPPLRYLTTLAVRTAGRGCCHANSPGAKSINTCRRYLYAPVAFRI